MQKVTQKLTVASSDELSRLLGSFDENLEVISREAEVELSVFGQEIKVSGEENKVEVCVTVLNKLLDIIRAHEVIDKNRIIDCIELAKEGNTEGIEKIMSGVLAITARGKQIKYKTVGQKKYVDAIKKNTVVFAVGPAGTGKTYLAGAMAVSA